MEERGPLLEENLDVDPVVQFRRWFEEARAAGARAPEATVLATATPDGAPSARMVLVKCADADGFVFYTNYESRKAGELDANPRAALLVHWDALGRQVRVEGTVRRISREESEAYFRTRPRGAQLGAIASCQSRPIRSRGELDERVAEVEREHQERMPELPAWWGGYRLQPEVFEFWQHRDDRLHDRLRYRRNGAVWERERLQP